MPRGKHRRKKGSGPKSTAIGDRTLPPLPDPRSIERDIASIFASDREMTELDRAQELMYDAWEAGTSKRRIALALKALKISPRCADAYALLAEHSEPGSDEKLRLYRAGVEAGEQALGKRAFSEDVGHFWGLLETRPYMRARQGLAQTLWQRGAREDALEHYRGMLRLNPNDNQGIRYLLLACYLELESMSELEALLRKYREDGAAAWTYTAALAAFRREGDAATSRKLLTEGFRSNRHVPAYLLGERRLPEALPDYISWGGEDEAAYYAVDFAEGWRKVPGVLDWLARHCEKAGPPS